MTLDPEKTFLFANDFTECGYETAKMCVVCKYTYVGGVYVIMTTNKGRILDGNGLSLEEKDESNNQ